MGRQSKEIMKDHSWIQYQLNIRKNLEWKKGNARTRFKSLTVDEIFNPGTYDSKKKFIPVYEGISQTLFNDFEGFNNNTALPTYKLNCNGITIESRRDFIHFLPDEMQKLPTSEHAMFRNHSTDGQLQLLESEYMESDDYVISITMFTNSKFDKAHRISRPPYIYVHLLNKKSRKLVSLFMRIPPRMKEFTRYSDLEVLSSTLSHELRFWADSKELPLMNLKRDRVILPGITISMEVLFSEDNSFFLLNELGVKSIQKSRTRSTQVGIYAEKYDFDVLMEVLELADMNLSVIGASSEKLTKTVEILNDLERSLDSIFERVLSGKDLPILSTNELAKYLLIDKELDLINDVKITFSNKYFS